MIVFANRVFSYRHHQLIDLFLEFYVPKPSMITRDAVVDGSGNLDHLGFINMH